MEAVSANLTAINEAKERPLSISTQTDQYLNVCEITRPQ
jgi:hypothetical protein